MKPFNLIVPIAVLSISQAATALELRAISPEAIKKVEDNRNLTITEPLVSSGLVLARDKDGNYVVSGEKLRALIAEAQKIQDPVATGVLRDLLGGSVVVKSVNIHGMAVSTQDFAVGH